MLEAVQLLANGDALTATAPKFGQLSARRLRPACTFQLAWVYGAVPEQRVVI